MIAFCNQCNLNLVSFIVNLNWFLDTSVDIDTEIEREHRDHILYQCNPKCVSGHIC